MFFVGKYMVGKIFIENYILIHRFENKGISTR